MSVETNKTLTDQLFDGTLTLWGKVVAVMILAVVIFAVWFHIRVGLFGAYVALIQRPIHVMMFAFLVYTYDRRFINGPKSFKDFCRLLIWNILPAILCIIVLVYELVNYDELIMRMGMAEPEDFFFGMALLVLILEATRRSVGLPVALIGATFLAYAFLGPYFPDVLQHPGFSMTRIVGLHLSGTNGIFFGPVGVMADFIVMFILFGALLAESGAGRYLIDLSSVLVGRSAGGPAKLAVISSGFMGTISGSVLANIATTGSFTIPLMKKTGYRANFAGAVEAVASTGGQIMPPIMGASAFIMAANLGLPYLTIAKAAAIPAVLYFLALLCGVHFEAKKTNIGAVPPDQIPSKKTALLNGSFFILPIAALLLFLILGYSMMRVGFVLLVFTAALCMVRRDTRLTPRRILRFMETGIKSSMGVAVTIATAGIIVGSLLMTGLGFKITQFILESSGGNIFLALFITMLISLILGMGMTTVAVYVILTSLLSSSLEQMGANILAVHFFIFYFGNVSHITPPVALGSFAAAAVAGGNFWKTSLESARLGVVAFLVPYYFVVNPVLLFIGSGSEIAFAAATAIVGVIALTASMHGWLILATSVVERVLLIICSLLLIKPGLFTDAIGLAIITLVLILQFKKKGRVTLESARA